MHRKVKTSTVVIAAWIAGCVSSSDIVPAGKDSYLVTGRANGGLNAGKGIIHATQQANAYCTREHKFMIIRHVETTGNAAIFGETTSLIFSCVDKNDPEYTRPDLRRDPNTVIEDQRH